MSDDLPELVDVSSSKKTVNKKNNKNDDKKVEEEFKLVTTKRKRKEISKMDTEEVGPGADDEDLDDIDIDDSLNVDEEGDNLRDQNDNLPLQSVKFPPIQSEKLMVN
jgi:hypothetical protein